MMVLVLDNHLYIDIDINVSCNGKLVSSMYQCIYIYIHSVSVFIHTYMHAYACN